MTEYKLNIARDVDADEPGVYILNLPKGFRLDECSSPTDRHHVAGFESMKELRAAVRRLVIPCDCAGCK